MACGIGGSSGQQPNQLVRRAVDTDKDGHVAQRVPPGLSIPQGGHEVLEGDEIIRFVGDDELLIVQAGRIGEELKDLREVVPDTDVLVYHPLPCTTAAG